MSENLSGHIDPISHDPIPVENLVEIKMLNHIEFFDIDHLDTWFLTRGEPINPLTNIGFTKQQIQDIRNAYIKRSRKLPRFLHSDSNNPIFNHKDYEKYVLLCELCINLDRIEELRDFLYTHSDDIHNDKFDLNVLIPVLGTEFDSATPLMLAVVNNNLPAVQELLVFNPALNTAEPKCSLKAIDFAVNSKDKDSYEILQHLLFYGAKTDIPIADNRYCYELTTDPAKLELIYTFTG